MDKTGTIRTRNIHSRTRNIQDIKSDMVSDAKKDMDFVVSSIRSIYSKPVDKFTEMLMEEEKKKKGDPDRFTENIEKSDKFRGMLWDNLEEERNRENDPFRWKANIVPLDFVDDDVNHINLHNVETVGYGGYINIFYKDKDKKHKLNVIKKLSKGSYGEVYSYTTEEETPYKIAVKTFDDMNNFIYEENIINKHHDILTDCKLLPSRAENGHVLLPLKDGNLHEYITEIDNLNDMKVISILKNLSETLYCLSRNGLFYTDFKTENILYSEISGEDKISLHLGDLGSICESGEKHITSIPYPKNNNPRKADCNDTTMVWGLAHTYLTLLYKCKSPRSYIKNNNFSNPFSHTLIGMFIFGNFEYREVREEYQNMNLSLNEWLERAKEEGIDPVNIDFQSKSLELQKKEIIRHIVYKNLEERKFKYIGEMLLKYINFSSFNIGIVVIDKLYFTMTELLYCMLQPIHNSLRKFITLEKLSNIELIDKTHLTEEYVNYRNDKIYSLFP